MSHDRPPASGAFLFVLGDARLERGKLLVRQAVHRVQNEISGIVGFIAVRLAAIFFRRDDVQRHVFTNRVLDVVLELLVEHLALLNGQLALF